MQADRRQIVFGAAAALALAFSAGADTPSPTAPMADDMTLGDPAAPLTLIEFGSAACPHCVHFHETVFAQLKANYIDTGKVHFIFREMLTPPDLVALDGFQVARCNGANAEQYFARLGDIFAHQQDMFATGTMQGVLTALNGVGERAGLSPVQVMQCMNDSAGLARLERFGANANQFNVSGTPTLILNGQTLEGADPLTYEGLSRRLDQALAAHR